MKIAITGGIGSGKSYVCKLLQQRGIAVYDSDARAKRLMSSSAVIQQQLSNLLGKNIFVKGILQKAVLTRYLLSDSQHVKAINDIVHPVVATDFISSDYDWIESAIFFDSGFDKRIKIDKVVCVTAPEQVRIYRIMGRDNITEDKARAWIKRQLPECEILARSNYNIINDGKKDLDKQITAILASLQKDSKNI